MPATFSKRHTCHRRRAAGAGLATLLALLSVLVTAQASAHATAQIDPNAKREIAGLLQAVGQSGCQFIRSGTVHAAHAAQAHLNRKYEYMAARNMLVSAEDFIVKAATRSRMTGQAYGMRCGDGPAQPADEWLMGKLKALRQTPP